MDTGGCATRAGTDHGAGGGASPVWGVGLLGRDAGLEAAAARKEEKKKKKEEGSVTTKEQTLAAV